MNNPPHPPAQLPRPERAALRRAWGELPVRPWLLLTVGLLVGACGLLTTNLVQYRFQRNLVLHGELHQGQVVAIEGGRPMTRNRPVAASVTWDSPFDQRQITESVRLPPMPGATLHLGDIVPIRVHRTNSKYWTYETQPPPFRNTLIGPAIVAALAVPVFAVTAWRRAGVLKTLRKGSVVEGVVQAATRTPVAPRSWLLKVQLGQRLVECLYPDRLGRPEPGRTIRVIAGDGAVALPVDAYFPNPPD